MDLSKADYQKVLVECKQILKECFEKYDIEEVFLAFNGGKDCTLLLDITLQLLKELYPNRHNRLKVVYMRPTSPFPELEDFIEEIKRYYNLDLLTVEGDIKAALQKIIDDDSRLKAVLMGTRKTDPHSLSLQHMQYTDPGWPTILRVSPLLNWSYHEVWSYILANKVPYCKLYDMGYTSIGSTYNTRPNPALQYVDEDGARRYRPAYWLPDGALERDGRISGNSAAQPTSLHNGQPAKP